MKDRILVEKLNDIIREAIEHGGDRGGAYFSNRDGLVNAMKGYLTWTGMNEKVGIMDDEGEMIQFFLKRHIAEE